MVNAAELCPGLEREAKILGCAWRGCSGINEFPITIALTNKLGIGASPRGGFFVANTLCQIGVKLSHSPISRLPELARIAGVHDLLALFTGLFTWADLLDAIWLMRPCGHRSLDQVRAAPQLAYPALPPAAPARRLVPECR